MKKIFFTLVLLLLTVSYSYSADFAVVDMDSVIKNSLAYSKALKALEKQKDDTEKKIKSRETDLLKEKENLESTLMTLSDDVKKEKVSKYEEKVSKFEKNVRDEQDKLQKTYSNVTIEAINNVKLVIADMKKEPKYNYKVVMPAASLPYYDKNLDISQEVLKRLNEKWKESQTLKK